MAAITVQGQLRHAQRQASDCSGFAMPMGHSLGVPPRNDSIAPCPSPSRQAHRGSSEGQASRLLWPSIAASPLPAFGRTMTRGGVHRCQIPTTNGLERLNREIARRVDAVAISPTRAAAPRLIRAVPMDQDAEWATSRRYGSMPPLTQRPAATASLPNLPCEPQQLSRSTTQLASPGRVPARSPARRTTAGENRSWLLDSHR